jgi:hypothetical protein
VGGNAGRRSVETRLPRSAKPRVDPSRTKFDVWLDRCCNDRMPITVCLKFNPYATEGFNSSTVHVCQVDRYMVLFEFPDGSCWWIPKDGILAAATAT